MPEYSYDEFRRDLEDLSAAELASVVTRMWVASPEPVRIAITRVRAVRDA